MIYFQIDDKVPSRLGREKIGQRKPWATMICWDLKEKKKTWQGILLLWKIKWWNGASESNGVSQSEHSTVPLELVRYTHPGRKELSWGRGTVSFLSQLDEWKQHTMAHLNVHIFKSYLVTCLPVMFHFRNIFKNITLSNVLL